MRVIIVPVTRERFHWLVKNLGKPKKKYRKESATVRMLREDSHQLPGGKILFVFANFCIGLFTFLTNQTFIFVLLLKNQ